MFHLITRCHYLVVLIITFLITDNSSAFHCRFLKKYKPNNHSLYTQVPKSNLNDLRNVINKTIFVKSFEDLEDGMELEISGEALHAKPAPTIQCDGFSLYMYRFQSWPKEFENKLVTVNGKIKLEIRYPPVKDSDLYADVYGKRWWIIPETIKLFP